MCAGCRTCAIVYKIYMKQLFSAVLNGLLATQLFSVSVMVILVVQVLTLCSVCYTCKQESGSIAHEYQHRHLLPMSISTDEIMYAIAMWLPRCMPLPRYAMPHLHALVGHIYIYIERDRERDYMHMFVMLASVHL